MRIIKMIDVFMAVECDHEEEELGRASGSAILPLLKKFAEEGRGHTLKFYDNSGSCMFLIQSNGGDLQAGEG